MTNNLEESIRASYGNKIAEYVRECVQKKRYELKKLNSVVEKLDIDDKAKANLSADIIQQFYQNNIFGGWENTQDFKSADLITQYFKDISKEKPPSPEENIEYAKSKVKYQKAYLKCLTSIIPVIEEVVGYMKKVIDGTVMPYTQISRISIKKHSFEEIIERINTNYKTIYCLLDQIKKAHLESKSKKTKLKRKKELSSIIALKKAKCSRLITELEFKEEYLNEIYKKYRELFDAKAKNSKLENLLCESIQKSKKRISRTDKYFRLYIDARNTLVKKNLRFAAAMAFKKGRKNIEESIQGANLGLIKAAEYFKLEYNTMFSTYAFYWISQLIHKEIWEKDKTILLPARVFDLKNKIKRARAEREPIEKIAEKTGLSTEQIIIIETADSIISLDGDIQSHDRTLNYFIADKKSSYPLKEADKKNLQESVLRIVETLDSRTSKVLKKFFGLNNTGKYTLSEIAKDMRLSRERIRQIKDDGIEKLSMAPRINHLRRISDNAPQPQKSILEIIEKEELTARKSLWKKETPSTEEDIKNINKMLSQYEKNKTYEKLPAIIENGMKKGIGKIKGTSVPLTLALCPFLSKSRLHYWLKNHVRCKPETKKYIANNAIELEQLKDFHLAVITVLKKLKQSKSKELVLETGKINLEANLEF